MKKEDRYYIVIGHDFYLTNYGTIAKIYDTNCRNTESDKYNY